MRRPCALALGITALLCLLILAPLLGPGFVLNYDMVFVPELPLTRELFGLGTTLPRAVPSDLLVALFSRLAPAEVLQKGVLIGILMGAGWGVARLAPSATRVERAAASSFFVWNPYVYERLVVGQWTLLLSYAALPWVARSSIDLRRARPWAAPRLALSLAVASFGSPPGGFIATLLALAMILVPRWSGELGALARRGAFTLLLAVALNGPWWIPGILHPGGLPSRPEGVVAFAAQADTKLGLFGSLLTLGGIWNDRVVPPGRATWTAVPALVLILAVVAAGLRFLARRWSNEPVVGLLTAAGLGLALALAPALPGVSVLFERIAQSVPAAGLFRDSQRFVAPLALVEALGFAFGVGAIIGGLSRSAGRIAAGALVALPVITLPALAWGASGRLGTTHYPTEWSRARAIMASDDVAGGMAILPWHQYVRFDWNGGRVVYNPASKFFSRRAVGNDALELREVTVPGEDPWAQLVAPAIQAREDRSAELADAGIRYVLLLKVGELHGPIPVDDESRILDTPELSLYRLRGGEPPPHFPTPPATPVVIGDTLAAGVVVWAVAQMALLKRRRR